MTEAFTAPNTVIMLDSPQLYIDSFTLNDKRKFPPLKCVHISESISVTEIKLLRYISQLFYHRMHYKNKTFKKTIVSKYQLLI